MRLAVYLDYVHRRAGTRVYAPRAFSLFVSGLRPAFDTVMVAGRVDPGPGTSHYPVPDDVEFVALPYYASAASPAALTRALRGALRAWDDVLRRVDAVWILGPQGLALPLAGLALARRKRVILGARQDLPAYARSRHPDRRLVHVAADLLDGAFRRLGRRVPIVAVGPALAARYRGGAPVLALTVSLISERQLETTPPERGWDGELTALSVGRLEEEKNPLLLADILARLHGANGRWRLAVCGEGPLEDALRARLAAMGVADAADLRGYLPLDGGLSEAYREAHAFLHVSRTEGVPQVLFEAFAAGVPVVATDVGGVRDATGGAALLIPPDDARAAADALERLRVDPDLRRRLVAAGTAQAREHTIERETSRLVAFLRDGRLE